MPGRYPFPRLSRRLWPTRLEPRERQQKLESHDLRLGDLPGIEQVELVRRFTQTTLGSPGLRAGKSPALLSWSCGGWPVLAHVGLVVAEGTPSSAPRPRSGPAASHPATTLRTIMSHKTVTLSHQQLKQGHWSYRTRAGRAETGPGRRYGPTKVATYWRYAWGHDGRLAGLVHQIYILPYALWRDRVCNLLAPGQRTALSAKVSIRLMA